MNIPRLHEYLPKYASVLLKTASVELERPAERDLEMTGRTYPEHPVRHAVGTVGKGLLAFSGGTLAGYGGAKLLADKYPDFPGHLLKAAPWLGGGLGVAYTLWKANEAKELHRALQAYRNKRNGRTE